MSAFVDQVSLARRSMRGRRTDSRVHKAFGQLGGHPFTPQIDQPQGLGNTPPAEQAHDMYEGIDLTSPNMMNDMYQRYGPAVVHAAVRKHSARDLKAAAEHPDLHPRVRTLLHAAAAVRKAFDGGNPMLPSNPAGSYPDSTPNISIPSRPSHGAPGNPVNPYPATVGARSHSAPAAGPNQAAVTQEPQTAGSASRGGSTAETVSRQWVYTPSSGNPVEMPMDKDPGGVGDNDQDYNGSKNGRYVGPVQAGDLVHFNGPGGSKFQAKVTQVTTGAVIGEFAGQTCTFPLDSISPHRIGGADHATDQGTPGGLTDSRGPKPIGVGEKSPEANEFKPGGSNLTKSQTDAIYNGGQGMSAHSGADAGTPDVQNPDDGAKLTPYNAERPYSADEGERTGPPQGNPVQGSMTARERMLIAQIVSHKAPGMQPASAALKALNAGTATDADRAVLVKALRTHALAVPARRAAVAAVTAKLLP